MRGIRYGAFALLSVLELPLAIMLYLTMIAAAVTFAVGLTGLWGGAGGSVWPALERATADVPGGMLWLPPLVIVLAYLATHLIDRLIDVTRPD